MRDRAREFYDDLSSDYHLLFEDWDASISRQGAILDGLIVAAAGRRDLQVLDCACGIGTQAIALAGRGYRVIGSDLSANAARRAVAEAGARGLAIGTAAADMRHLPFASSSVDVVVCADNAIAHLLHPDQLELALIEMRRVLRSGGLLLLTVRSNFARETHPTVTPIQLSRTAAGTVITFQLWDWHEDGEHYDMQHIQLHPDGDSYAVRVRRATSWAITSGELVDLVAAVGFDSLALHAPEDTGFYQPILAARRH